jgi:hypothetical protein
MNTTANERDASVAVVIFLMSGPGTVRLRSRISSLVKVTASTLRHKENLMDGSLNSAAVL